MPLSAGTRLGPYEIVSALGAGGMGEVYRARDTRRERIVAIKILPEHLSANPDLRARFNREAKTISALQHANICVLHDVGSEAGIDFLVMEFLEGETLSARLARKPLPLDESLRIAVEVASALDAAHRNGVVHRDLKPGNIMLTKSGAKLMDFGLAKPFGLQGGGPAAAFSAVATMTSPAPAITAAGTIVGTVQYMSPEQIQGLEADARSDLFAFGATLYEMLTGTKAFAGKSQLSVASAILEKDPEPLGTRQPVTPPMLGRIVKRCLVKDPSDRWQNAHDLAFELKWVAEGGAVPAATSDASRRLRDLLVYGALAVAMLLAAVLGLYWRGMGVPAQTVTAEIAPPSNARFSFFGPAAGAPALSPDGRTLAFCAMDDSGKAMLWVRSLDSGAARTLPETEGANDPFWSVDGKVLGFFADSRLKTIAVSGGSVIAVSAAPVEGGGSWNRDGTILFAPDYGKGIYKTSAGGGSHAVVLTVDAPKVNVYSYPKCLPDGNHFLYLASGGDPAAAGIYFASLDGKENRLLVRSNSAGIYASGFLLYVRNGALVAQAFDPTRGHFKEDAYPIVEDISTSGGTGIFTASENGNMVYLKGTGAKRLTWFDRAGKSLGSTGEAADYYDLGLSPDGRMLASNAGFPVGSTNSEIWIDDLLRSVRMRLTIDPDTDHGIPVWSPDSSKIAFAALRGTARVGIYEKSANGAGETKLILASENPNMPIWPTSWSRDGRFILFTHGNISLTLADVWVLPMSETQKPHVLLKTPAPTYGGQFAPDGRWVAYTSEESGKAEVYVVPFDIANISNQMFGQTKAGRKWQISAGGGRFPRWRGDGKEIFYLSPSNFLMSAEVEHYGKGVVMRAPQRLFRTAAFSTVFAPYDVTADGKKFIINTVGEQNTPLTLVVNWMANLTKR